MMLLLTLLGALAQDPKPSAPPTGDDPSRGWVTVDQIVMVVNQDIITESQMRAELNQIRKQRQLTSDTDIVAAQRQILNELVRKRLAVQAGAVLGVDEKLIDARVAESLEQMRKRSNGVVGLVKFLKSKDVEGADVRRLLRDDIYEQLYRDGVTGDAPGPLGRVTADQYIRPGALTFMYQQAIDRPKDMEALGGKVGLVKFQQVVLDVDSVGGPDAAQRLARELKTRIEGGEDMGALVRQYGGLRDDEGIANVEEPRLRELFPEIAGFTATAAPDQLSEPIAAVQRASGKAIVRIVRFLGRTPAVVPEFRDAAIQSKLRQHAQSQLENYRLESGFRTLLAASYVWPPELAGREKR